MSRDQLQEAYRLIREGNKTDAVRMLLPVVRADSSNADAWWLLANAIADPEQAKRALKHVLQLRPDDERARKLMIKLGGDLPSAPSRQAAPPPRYSAPPARSTSDEDDPFASPPPPVSSRSAFDDDDPFANVPPAHSARAAFDDDDPFASPPPAQSRSFSANDDPFADLDANSSFDPFADVAAPQTSSPKSKRTPRPVEVRTSSGGGTNPLVYILAGIGCLVLVPCLLCTVASSLGMISLASIMPQLGQVMEEVMLTITADPNFLTGLSSGGDGSLLPSDLRMRGTVEIGGTVRGTVDTFDDDGWTMQGQAGTRITIDLRATDGELDPQLYLYNPSDRQIADNDDIDLGTNYDSRITITLPDTGQYTLVVSAFGNGGDYELSVRRS